MKGLVDNYPVLANCYDKLGTSEYPQNTRRAAQHKMENVLIIAGWET